MHGKRRRIRFACPLVRVYSYWGQLHQESLGSRQDFKLAVPWLFVNRNLMEHCNPLGQAHTPLVNLLSAIRPGRCRRSGDGRDWRPVLWEKDSKDSVYIERSFWVDRLNRISPEYCIMRLFTEPGNPFSFLYLTKTSEEGKVKPARVSRSACRTVEYRARACWVMVVVKPCIAFIHVLRQQISSVGLRVRSFMIRNLLTDNTLV